jgi:hypothetical protein
MNIYDANGNLDISLIDQDELAALPADERARIDTLIASAKAVEFAETAAKGVDDLINKLTTRRQDLLKRLPPRPSASDLHTANVKAELARAAARRGQ